MSHQNAFIVAGLVQVLTFLMFIKWDKKTRKTSVHSSHHYLEEMTATGSDHQSLSLKPFVNSKSEF